MLHDEEMEVTGCWDAATTEKYVEATVIADGRLPSGVASNAALSSVLAWNDRAVVCLQRRAPM